MIPNVPYQMYAVLIDDVIVAGTLAYSRAAAIGHFIGSDARKWAEFKRAGYRTSTVAVTLIVRGERA